MQKKTFFFIIISTLVIGLNLSAALNPESVSNIKAIGSVFTIIKNNYVKKIEDKNLIESAISGMLSSLDPNSSYLDKNEYQEIKSNVKGEFSGIGAELIIDKGLRIVTPIDDTPAVKAGLLPGDYITKINSEEVAKMTPSQAINKLRGKKGSEVVLTIKRAEQSFDVVIIRDVIKVKTVKWHLYENDIGYVRISTFLGNTADSLNKALASLAYESKNNIKGYIIDLRNNPGGLLQQAIYSCEIFLDDGIIVSTKGRNDKDNIVYRVNAKSSIVNIPMVVLINGGSASGSEIFAGAMQDHKRAVIVGTKSYGKASVQTVMPLPFQDLGAIRLTTALYYTPSGRLIDKTGIVPDILIEDKNIKSKKDTKKVIYNSSTMHNTDWQYLRLNDKQLQKGLELLESINMFGKKQ